MRLVGRRCRLCPVSDITDTRFLLTATYRRVYKVSQPESAHRGPGRKQRDLRTFTPPFLQFGGQPYFNDFLSKNFKSSFTNAFGEKNGKAMMSATAGSYAPPAPPIPRLLQVLTSHRLPACSLTGIGEIVLLPLDVLKIKRQ